VHVSRLAAQDQKLVEYGVSIPHSVLKS
jgi:hypothetical protein